MCQRDLRKLRQTRERERITFAALVSGESRARSRVLKRFDITVEELADLYTGRIQGAALDERVRVRRCNRAEAIRIAGSESPLWQRRQRIRELEVDPEVADLVTEQEKDDTYFVPKRPWLLSLDDHQWAGSGNDEDHYERGGIGVYLARKHGDFSNEAPWVPPLIERLDRELAVRRAA